MRRPAKPGGATHWDTEAGFYCKRQGQVVAWWGTNPQTGDRVWLSTSIDAIELDWNLRFEEL